MAILNNSAKINMIIILPMHAYPLATHDLGLKRSFLADTFLVDELLVFNPMTSTSESLTRMEISTTTHLISCKPILLIRQLYKMKIRRKESSTTAEMKTMKETVTTTMELMNRQKRNKMLGVEGIVVLIVI